VGSHDDPWTDVGKNVEFFPFAICRLIIRSKRRRWTIAHMIDTFDDGYAIVIRRHGKVPRELRGKDNRNDSPFAPFTSS